MTARTGPPPAPLPGAGEAAERAGRWHDIPPAGLWAAWLVSLVVSPVLSPQYLLWVIGLAAVCLATGCTTQRPAALVVLASAGLTQLIFPALWPALVSGSALATCVLVVRNLLLVVAAVLSCRRILRASSVRSQPADSRVSRVSLAPGPPA